MPEFVAGAAEAGVRLDTALARRLGASRAAAQRLIESGAVTVDGAPAGKGARAARRRERSPTSCRPSRDHPRRRGRAVHAWSTKTTRCWSSTSRPAWSCIRRRATSTARWSRGCSARHRRRARVAPRAWCTASTATPRACSSWRARSRRTAAWSSRWRAARSPGATWRCWWAPCPRTPARSTRRSGRHVRDRKRMSIHTTRPRRAVTHFTVRRRLAGYTLLDVRLETGRTHQIRVHFAALGYPVAGDVTYGGRARRPAGLARQFLHAAHLEFAHPLERRAARLRRAPARRPRRRSSRGLADAPSGEQPARGRS